MARRPSVTAAMCAYERRLADARLSPDGEQVAYVAAPPDGRPVLVLAPALGGPEVALTTDVGPRSARTMGGGTFDWTPDGSALVFAGGDGNLWLVASSGGEARPLTRWHSRDEPAAGPSVSPDGTRVAYTVGQRDVAVATLEPGGPWPVRVGRGEFVMDATWSPDGRTVVWHEWEPPHMPWDESRLMAAPADGSTRPVALAVPGGCQLQQPRFGGPSGHLGFLCDADGWLNVWSLGPDGPAAPVLAERHEHGGPTWGEGQRSFAWSPDGRSVAVCRNEDGFGRLVVVDRSTGATRELAKGVHGCLSWQGQRLAAIRTGGRTPTQVVTYDLPTGRRHTVAIGPPAGFPDEALPEPETVGWTSADGVTIPARLYRAATHGAAAGPAPLIVWVHGGPTDQWQVTFRPRFAFFVDRGWSILVPDHRGSTGHGRAFAQALNGRWGEADVADVVAGVDTALAAGWALPGALVVMGGSAGGFTALNVALARPDAVAAAVVAFPVSDLVELHHTTHRFEAHYDHQLVGPLPAARDRFVERSPLTRAASLRVPLLVFHGTDDEVVPLGQSRRLVDAVTGAGGVAELCVFEGEGHGWGRPATVVAELERTLAFLHRYAAR